LLLVVGQAAAQVAAEQVVYWLEAWSLPNKITQLLLALVHQNYKEMVLELMVAIQPHLG